jgi:hypothetical protein
MDELRRQVAGELRKLIPVLIDRQQEVGEEVRLKGKGALPGLVPVLETWSAILEGSVNLSRADSGKEEEMVSLLVRTQQHLKEMKEALARQDLVALGDTLQFELEPLARDWERALEALV